MTSDSSLGWRPIAVFLLAVASVGGTVGYLAGQSGPDAKVLAAVVLPIVISGAGSVLVTLLKSTPETPLSYYITSFAIIVFITSLLAGAHIGHWSKDYADRIEQEEASEIQKKVIEFQKEIIEIQHKIRTQYFQRCAREEYIINRGRQALELSPLPTEFICGDPPNFSVPGPVGPHPPAEPAR